MLLTCRQRQTLCVHVRWSCSQDKLNKIGLSVHPVMFWLVDIKISAVNNHRKTKKRSKLIGRGMVSGDIFLAAFPEWLGAEMYWVSPGAIIGYDSWSPLIHWHRDDRRGNVDISLLSKWSDVMKRRQNCWRGVARSEGHTIQVFFRNIPRIQSRL